jgi:hypothetical protein
MFACSKFSYASRKAVAEQLFCHRGLGSLVPIKDSPLKADMSIRSSKILAPDDDRRRFAAVEDKKPVLRRALATYKEIYGDLLVPSTYTITVGCRDWPQETWGLKLGRAVSNIRSGRSYSSMRSELLSIGFEFKSPPRKEFRKMKTGLLRYKELFGNMLVPTAFCVPYDDERWPSQTWGLKLGRVVSLIRGGRVYASLRDELLSIGFDFKSQKKEYGATCVLLALARYKQLHGDLQVPHTYSVPVDTDKWPKQTWGMKLGCVVTNIRKGFSYKAEKAELCRMGFVFMGPKKSYAEGFADLGLLKDCLKAVA